MQEISDSFETGLATCTSKILDLLEISSTPIVLIDGPGASGKSTFAQKLQDEIFRSTQLAPRIIHMDDLYPGWEGLAAGSRYLHDQILFPLQSKKRADYQIWDWEQNQRGSTVEPGNGWRHFDGGNLLIVEGCGSLSKQTSEFADLRIWLDANREVRKQRWHNRDSGTFDEYFNSWELQESEFFQANDSQALADIVLTS